MEMASAHGLALKLVEMSRLDRINRNQCEIISEEDKIIKTWFIASNQRFSRLEYVNLSRRTLLFVLSQMSLKEVKKKELLKGVSVYFNKFSSVLKDDIRRPLIDVIVDPWKNTCFSWEELFQKRITLWDKKVQEYFCAEPEEIVLARVHLFSLQGKEEMAMTLAKNSFLYHTRIAKHLSVFPEHQVHNQKSNPVIPTYKFRKGAASMDWYLSILQRKKSLLAIFNEVKQLTCHEGVLLVQRLRRNKKNLSFALNLLQLFLMQELIRPSKFCCTKKIFSLWCILHKEQKTSMYVFSQEIRKVMATYAPSSAHFYLLVDALWEQFGSSFITMYVELYARGLTVDLNHLEAAKHGETQEDVVYLESHIASMFAKLSTLFSDFHEGASRECMFSAFSLKPTKERLYILQSLTHSILSAENEMKSNSSSMRNSASLVECKCGVKCTDSCKSIKEHFLEHPILTKGIPNVPYCVVKDLVSVLESVRCVQFQYNLFDWHNNAIDLGDYLRDFNLSKSWESDTEYASEGSIKSSDEGNVPASESLYAPTKMDVDPVPLSVKRKSESDDEKQFLPLEIGANIEVGNGDFVNKRIKIVDQNQSSEIIKHDIYNVHTKPVRNFSSAVEGRIGMEDAIENVIRMTLDNNRLKTDQSLDNTHSTFMSSSLDHAHDGTEKISLSPTFNAPEYHVYPYSLTSQGKKKNLNANYKVTEYTSAIKSDAEDPVKFLTQVLTPRVSRESVISPVVNKHSNLNTMQEQSCTQIAQNKFSVKTVSVPCYSKVKDNEVPVTDVGKKIPLYQQEAINLGCKTSKYEQIRNVSNTVTQSSQFISKQTAMQLLHKSNVSASEFSKVQCLPNTSVTTSGSLSAPINLTQSKGTVVMHPSGYPPTSLAPSSSSMFRTNSTYQVDNSNTSKAVVKRVDQSISCFQNNQFVHCDRSSVIQHTMQHVQENLLHNQSNDVQLPNQLAVSVNSNAAEQIRSAPKDGNLPPFTVNVTDRTISNSNLAVSANFVIARKSQPQIEASSPPSVCKDLTTVSNTDTITIPGILASPSVIVSPWEAQHKSHGEMSYKKNANAVNVSTIDKRIYKNRIPTAKSIFKPEVKMIRQKIVNDANSQVFKAIASSSHSDTNFHTLPSTNQSNINPKQSLTVVKKASTHAVSQPTTSQPWYSEPYPKPYNTGNISSSSNRNVNIAIKQSTSSTVKAQPTKHASEVKSLTMYTVKSSNNPRVVIPAAASTTSSSFNNPILNSTKSSIPNVSTFSSPKIDTLSSTTAVSNKNILLKDSNPTLTSMLQSNSLISLKTYSTNNNPLKNNSVYSSQLSNKLQLHTDIVQDKNYLAYKVPESTNSNLHFSQDSDDNYPNACCSPTEMNPCQNCSLPAENRLIQSASETNSDGCPQRLIPSNTKTIQQNDTAPASSCNSNISSNKDNADGFGHSNINAALASCQYCSHPFLESELQMHILNCPSKEFGAKSSLMDEINSNIILSENYYAKSLLDVPGQDALFQEQSFQNNLPHAKSFLNTLENPPSIEDKSLYEIEANAFNACMDLINNDKDLKRIVQGIDCLDQLDDNYLPFIPSVDSSNNFLNANLNNEDKVCDDTPQQKSIVSDKSDGFTNYAPNHEELQLQKSKLDDEKLYNSTFQYTEKESKSIQKIHSKPQASYTERVSVNTSKISNELAFSTVSELIKVTVTECSHNELKSLETGLKNNKKEISPTANPQKVEPIKFSCPYCSKKLRSPFSVKRHIFKLHQNVHANNSGQLSNKLTDLSSHTDKSDCNFEFENNNPGSGNSYHNSDSINHHEMNNHILHSSDQNPAISDTCETSVKFSCPYCSKKLRSAFSVKRHIFKVHQNIHANNSGQLSNKLTDLSSHTDKSDCNFEFENNNSGSGNSYHNSDSINCHEMNNHILHSSDQNPTISDTCEISGVLPKGRIKGLIKSPTTQCKFCNKTLTSGYMKRHILKQHQEIFLKTENSSSDLNVDINMDMNQSSPSQVDVTNISTISPLFEQDIDSSTCLSMSDALKRNNSYVVAETSNISESSDKIIENKNVKFNFNVLEFSKDTKVDYKLADPEEGASLNELPPKNADMFEGNIKNNNVSYTKQNKCVDHRFSCNLCARSYASNGILNRHLKTVHKVVIERTLKKNRIPIQFNEAAIKTEPNESLPANAFPKTSDSIDVYDKMDSTHLHKTPYIEKISHAPTNAQKMKERARNMTSPNSNKSLLKAVLQSNFVTKRLEINNCNESNKIASPRIDNTACDRNLQFCDTSKISKDDQGLCSTQLNAFDLPHSSKDYENDMHGLELKSDNGIVSVPFENLLQSEISASSEKCLYGSISGAEEYHHPLPPNFEFTHVNNELYGPSNNSEIKYADLNSQNLSIQSNEISPISEIISNVSKCQFVGTSSNDTQKEVFEDNSLKLIIPESQEKSKHKENQSIYNSCDTELRQKQEFIEVRSSVSTAEKPDSLDEKITELNDPNSVSTRIEVGENESWELTHDSDKNCIRCRLCHQNLNSMDILSKHLKEVHNIPVLKKHISQPCFTDELSFSEKHSKLSPPKLKLGTNESESESEFENLQSWPQPVNSSEDLSKEPIFDSSELESSKGVLYDSPELYKEAECDSSELESYKDNLYDSLELDESKEVLYDSSELEASQEDVLCDSFDLDAPKEEVLYDSSELDAPKEEVLDDSLKYDAPKEEVLDDSLKYDAPKEEVLNDSSKYDALDGSSEFNALKEEALTDSLELDVSKKLLCDSSELDTSKEVLYDSSELDTYYKNDELCEDNLCVLLSKQGEQNDETIVQNSSCKLKKSFIELEYKDVKKGHSNQLTTTPLKILIKNSGTPKAITSPPSSSCKNKCRRHSFSDTISLFDKNNPLFHNSKKESFDSKNNICKKSVSLPNLKIAFQFVSHHTKYKLISPKSSLEEQAGIEHSSVEHTSFSSVTDNTEICKNSCDSSSSSSSSHTSPPMQWNKITINPSFLLPKPLLSSSVPRLGRSKTILRSKFSGRKLIIQRLKTFKREKKSKKIKTNDFPHQKKFKTKKTFNPIILTLKERTEVSEFLKNHKQPIVKLIRLKENESDYLLNQKNDPVSEIICNKYDMKEAVVKLERMHIPCDIDKMVLINQELLVPNLLSQDTHSNSVAMQSHENESINCSNNFYLTSGNADVLPEVSFMCSPPRDIEELTAMNNSDSSTSDSVQFLGAITKQKCQTKAEEFCSLPSTKKCFVVLNRVSM